MTLRDFHLYISARRLEAIRVAQLGQWDDIWMEILPVGRHGRSFTCHSAIDEQFKFLLYHDFPMPF